MRIESMMAAPVAPVKVRATGDYLVEHYAEAENVGARVNAQPASLFGRHILRSAHYGSGHGLIRRAERGRGEWVFRLGPLRAIENEVGGGGNLGFARRQLISAGRVQRRRLSVSLARPKSRIFT